MTERSLAIIGGGASSVLLLAHLARLESARDMGVDMYDRSGRFGKGVAYSTVHDVHLLNVRAANMSAFQDDRDDFALWAGKRGYAPADFVPRKIYALYLREKLDEAAAVLSLNFLQEDVLKAVKGNGSVALETPSGNREYEQAVLASGNVRPLRPVVRGAGEGYFDDPWTMDMDAVLRAKNVALIGSGLSAVDVIIALHARQYKGNISVFSRNGLFPLAHAEPAVYEDFLHEKSGGVLSMLRLVRAEAEKASAVNVPWQAVVDALRHHTNPLWQGWTEKERGKFMKRLLTFWNVHRHRMAPQINDTLQSMISSGQVRVVRSRVDEVAAGPGVICGGKKTDFDAVINCLGYRYDEGRNFDVTARIGPARFGELFETTAIPEIRAQAADIADMLAQ